MLKRKESHETRNHLDTSKAKQKNKNVDVQKEKKENACDK